MRKPLVLAATLATALVLAACGISNPAKAEDAKKKTYDKPPEMKIDVNKTYTATIETDAGTMVAELYPKIAPQTVNSFVFL